MFSRGEQVAEQESFINRPAPRGLLKICRKFVFVAGLTGLFRQFSTRDAKERRSCFNSFVSDDPLFSGQVYPKIKISNYPAGSTWLAISFRHCDRFVPFVVI